VDLLGREVSVLVDEIRPSGSYEIQFDAARAQLSSGVYFYRLIAAGSSSTRRLLVLR
jgi:hypothetical protein